MKVALICKECGSKFMLEESAAKCTTKCPICAAPLSESDIVRTNEDVTLDGVGQGNAADDCTHVAPLVQQTQVDAEPVVDNHNPADDFEISVGKLKKYKGAGGEVVIPKGVFAIEPKAFFNCKSITSLVVTDGVRTIGDKAFFGCDNLTEVTLPDSVTVIGEGVFIGLKLQKINVDARNKTYCSVDGDLYTKDKKTLVQACAGKSAATVMLPAETRRVGAYAFFDCRNLQKIILPESVVEIGAHAFYNCIRLQQIDNSAGLRVIGEGAFAWCKKLCDYTIPEGCLEIGVKAFEHCVNLERVFISASVVKIGMGAFLDCLSLEKACFALRSGWFAQGESVSQTILSNEKKAAKLLRETYVGMTWTFGTNDPNKGTLGKGSSKKSSSFNNDLRDFIGKSL